MIKKAKYIFLLLIAICLTSTAQICSTAVQLASAISAANSGPAGTYVIQISGTILLSSDLPAIQLLNNNKSLTIMNGPNPAELKVVSPTSLFQGFMIDNGSSGASVLIKNVKFTDFNVYSTATFPVCWPPICIWAENANNVTIQTCTFVNHFTAIRYNNNIRNLRIENSVFITDGNVPSGICSQSSANTVFNVGAIAQSAFNSLQQAPLTAADDRLTTIIGNTLTLTNFVLPAYISPLSAIFISPWDISAFIFTNPPLTPFITDYKAKANVKIENNKISGYVIGIHQNMIPTIPSTSSGAVDNRYNLSIKSNTLNCYHRNITLTNPYRHFKIEAINVLNLLQQPVSTALDYSHLVLGTEYVLGGYSSSQVPKYNNKFGFDIIYQNSLSKAPVNNDNIFLKSSPLIKPNITTYGNFGDKALTANSNDGVNFIKMNYIGNIFVNDGKATSIRQTSLVANSSGFPIKHNSIIVPTGPEVIYGNGFIAAPIIKDAYVNGSIFNVAFEITGNQIIQPNGPFVVEFYKSNANQDLVSLLGSQTINVLTNQTYSLTFVLPNNATLAQGDKVAAHVTSIGTNNTPTRDPFGTSEVGYFDIPVCTDCLSDFAPEPGKTYIAGAWVKKGNGIGVQNGNHNAALEFIFYNDAFTYNSSTQIGSPISLTPSGPFSEGWQKIEGEILIPATAKAMKMRLIATPTTGFGNMYFDDIRFFPKDATMKSYAYDQNSMRLMAELDERNFATFYEYDEEGKLIRVKKETEKGIMTIKESRNSKPTR